MAHDSRRRDPFAVDVLGKPGESSVKAANVTAGLFGGAYFRSGALN